MRSELPPGPWLRLTALAAAGACGLAVASGALSFGTAHRLLAALAVPPLVALVAAAWVVHRRLLVPAASALVLFGAAALLTDHVRTSRSPRSALPPLRSRHRLPTADTFPVAARGATT